MNGTCLIITIFFLLFVIVGMKQGLFRVVISTAGLIVSMVLAIYVAPYVSGYLQEHTQLDDRLAEYIAHELQFSDTGKDATRGIQVAAINSLDLPDALKANILDNNNSEMYDALAVTGVYDYIAKSIAVVILNAAVFLILISVFRLFFFFLSSGMKILTKLPILKSIDKVGGGMLGGLKGLIWIWVFFLLLSITSTFEWSGKLIGDISSSGILKALYDNNLLVEVIGDLTKVLFH